MRRLLALFFYFLQTRIIFSGLIILNNLKPPYLRIISSVNSRALEQFLDFSRFETPTYGRTHLLFSPFMLTTKTIAKANSDPLIQSPTIFFSRFKTTLCGDPPFIFPLLLRPLWQYLTT